MPHNFVKITAMTPNPGRWTRARRKTTCERHHGTLEYLWFDEPKNPTYAYVLVKDGDLNGLLQDLHALEVIRQLQAKWSQPAPYTPSATASDTIEVELGVSNGPARGLARRTLSP